MGMTGILYPQARAKDGQNAGFSVPGTHKAEGRGGNLCSVPAFTARLRLRVDVYKRQGFICQENQGSHY